MADILKENEYKIVSLHRDGNEKYVRKQFVGHTPHDRQLNTEYLYSGLVFFQERFSDTLLIPKVFRANYADFSVDMEYLWELQRAKRLSPKTLSIAEGFFRKCYDIRNDCGFLKEFNNTALATKPVQLLLNDDFPRSLGFRGDLRENLVEFDGGIMMADIDSIAIEPLGLSEIILIAEIYCSLNPKDILEQIFCSQVKPVALDFLTLEQAFKLLEVVCMLIQRNMDALPLPVKSWKLSRSKHVITKLIESNYQT